MENTGFKIEFRIFYFIHLPNEKDYEIRRPAFPPDIGRR